MFDLMVIIDGNICTQILLSNSLYHYIPTSPLLLSNGWSAVNPEGKNMLVQQQLWTGSSVVVGLWFLRNGLNYHNVVQLFHVTIDMFGGKKSTDS